MSTDPLDTDVHANLEHAVETFARGGDFDATWQAAHATSARRLPVAGLAVAAAAAIVLALPLWRAMDHEAASTVPSTPWEEPQPLRFSVAPPAAAAQDAVRAAQTGEKRDQNAQWKAAMSATPEAEHAELASRRALFEQARGNLDAAQEAGQKGSPPGRLVAAEVHLVDLEREDAVAILRELKNDPRVGTTASAYLALIQRSAVAADLADVAALAQFRGAEKSACEAMELVESVFPPPPPDAAVIRAEAIALSPVLGRCPHLTCQEVMVIQGGKRTVQRLDAAGRPCQ